MKVKVLVALTLILIAAVAVIYFKPRAKEVSIKIGSINRILKPLILKDSMVIKASPEDLIATQKSFLFYKIPSSEPNPVIELSKDNTEKPLALPYSNKYCRSIKIANDTISLLLQKEDSLWVVQLTDGMVTYHKKLSFLPRLSFANLVSVNEVAIASETPDNSLSVTVYNLHEKDTLSFMLDNKFHYQKQEGMYYPGMIFNGVFLKKDSSIIYKSLYSSYGLVFPKGTGRHSVFRLLDSLDFPGMRNVEIAAGFFSTELYPEIRTTHKFVQRDGRYYSLSNLDNKGTINSYLDIYDAQFAYQYSFSFPRVRNTKPVSFTLDNIDRNIIYVLYDEIKTIYRYAIQ